MADEGDDLPYRAEYAKSGRASCRGCKGNIEKGTLRLAVLVQSPSFDGKMPLWFHFMCFFGKQNPKSVSNIAHFEELKFEDQEKIRKQVDERASGASSSTNGDVKKGSKKRAARKADGNKKLQLDYKIEYAVSSRAACRGCHEKIVKGEIRASKKDFESDEGKRYGGIDLWHHLECFVKLRSELGFFDCGDSLSGFTKLKVEDKAEVKKVLPEIVKTETDALDGEIPAKKIKVLEEDQKKLNEEKKKLKKQIDKIFKFRNILKNFKRNSLIQLLEYNNQKISSGDEKRKEILSDIMTFGALLPCEKCKNGQYVFRSGTGYVCDGSISEWVKCENVNLKPPRKPFKVPPEIVESCEELANYNCKVSDRLIQLNEKEDQPDKPSGSGDNQEPKVKLSRKLPFKGMDFFLYKHSGNKDKLKIAIEKLGGHVVSKLHSEVAAVVSTEAEVEKCTGKIKEAEELGIHVVDKEFIEKCKDLDDAVDKIVELAISSWGSDPKIRVERSRKTKSELKSMKSGKSRFVKSEQPSKIKVKVQSGTAVDPESGLDDVAHVYRTRDEVYTVTLGETDIQRGRNSYYKLQILESNKGKSYWLFRSWGRIGTTIGGTKLDVYKSIADALHQFRVLYEDKTGNMWENHKNFHKISGKMYPLSVDYGDAETKEKQLEALDATGSKLKKPIQELIMMIFDIDLMKKTMVEFEIDLEKMPLGKISKTQILEAYSVLTNLQGFIEQRDGDLKPDQRALIIEATNRFYTLVPHDFGIDNPPLLEDIEMLKNKMEMLDSLLEIECAYEIMKTSQEDGEHSLDAHFAKLNTDIDVIEHDSKEFDLIDQYVKNTHAATHSNYELEILEAFSVNRKEEEKRYKPFKKLPNRKLLWHGSRLTNFAGILSQGLRIAPPEAPTTGYMFGKGIYFADMVSKSANYCMASPNNNIGFILLCEVALGKMYECKSAEFIEKLPKGHHSCKGIGSTCPDPSGSITLETGVEVPAGKPKRADVDRTALLYNEYIVYDVAQVKTQYLLKLNFKYKY